METWRHIALFSPTYSSWTLVSIHLQTLCSGFTQHLECPATVIYLRTLGFEGHLRCRRPKYFADGDIGSLPSVRVQTPSRHFRDHPNGWSNSGVLWQDVRIWYPCENVLREIVRTAPCEALRNNFAPTKRPFKKSI